MYFCYIIFESFFLLLKILNDKLRRIDKIWGIQNGSLLKRKLANFCSMVGYVPDILVATAAAPICKTFLFRSSKKLIILLIQSCRYFLIFFYWQVKIVIEIKEERKFFFKIFKFSDFDADRFSPEK